MRAYIKSAVAGLALAAFAGSAMADDVVVFKPEQETVIREYVKKEPIASITLPGVELNVGSTVPDTVELHEIPDQTYRYTVVDNRTVLVDPGSHKIIHVMD
ncbi:DUF1236 domain-containing protein [Mesorhizobium sp. IMUNJ 23232]|uniref:DUF1236 domain-containing protein n=1 Tax=Mesorhizobium sp. IMUNJ 23232 TaxID=3376064 RepID=UPI003792371C